MNFTPLVALLGYVFQIYKMDDIECTPKLVSLLIHL